jgi:high affinity Mn2+ porin
MRFQRYFVKQTIGLGGGQEAENTERGNVSEQLESSENQLSQTVDVDRLSFTAGKFAVGDIFDANIYAHDPTRDFLNFSFNSMGSFDFASDAWGYSYGAAAEWKQSWWTLRAGVFQLPEYPGSFNDMVFCGTAINRAISPAGMPRGSCLTSSLKASRRVF